MILLCLNPVSWLNSDFLTWITRQVSLVEEKCLPYRSTWVYTQFFLCSNYIIIVYLFSFGHCIVCSMVYGFWLPFLYHQAHTVSAFVNYCVVWLFVRRVWRYQRGNQNPYIEEEQTTQWPKEKLQKDKQRSTKHTHKTKDRVTRIPLKTGNAPEG